MLFGAVRGRASKWARRVDFDLGDRMHFSEIVIAATRRRIHASGSRCTDSRVSDRASWTESAIDRPWNSHSQWSSTQTRRRTSGTIQPTGGVDDPSAFSTRAMRRNPLSPSDVLQNRGIGVTFALTRAHCIPQTTVRSSCTRKKACFS